MDYAQAVDLTAWGTDLCWLKLPGFTVCLNGLSVSQKQQIVSDYSSFVITKDRVSDFNHVISCQAYRLEAELSESINELENNGQYAPRIRRAADSIEITGFNFLAAFSIDAPDNLTASIGVAYEDEFALPLVLENFLRIYSAYNAVNLSGAILHSAGLVFDEAAYVFVGYSGVGKTTLTRKAHLRDATVLSDDLNLILPNAEGSRFDAFKVPFTGEFGRTVNQSGIPASFPVKAILLLGQDKEVTVNRVNSSVAISRLIAGSPFVNTDDEEIPRLFDIYSTLVGKTPVINLGVPLDVAVDDIMASINRLIRNEVIS